MCRLNVHLASEFMYHLLNASGSTLVLVPMCTILMRMLLLAQIHAISLIHLSMNLSFVLPLFTANIEASLSVENLNIFPCKCLHQSFKATMIVNSSLCEICSVIRNIYLS